MLARTRSRRGCPTGRCGPTSSARRPPGAQPVADQLGKPEPLQAAQVEPRLVAPPEQLEEGGDRADRQPGARGQQRGERGVEAGGLAPPRGSCQASSRETAVPVGVDERAGLGDRAEPDRPHLHVTGDPHQVGEQPVDGGDGIHGVALAPLCRGRSHGVGSEARPTTRRASSSATALVRWCRDRRRRRRSWSCAPQPREAGPDRSTSRSRGGRAISVPGRRACIVPGRRTASPGPTVHHSSGWRNWQTR